MSLLLAFDIIYLRKSHTMGNNITISVVTATWNCASTLPDCLASVARQNYANREHVIVAGDDQRNHGDDGRNFYDDGMPYILLSITR